MAEAIISQISDDFLECTICLEPYKNPKVLPCLHTFCKGCLEKFVAQQGEGKDGNFPCPTCRIETELPGGGVEGLKDNFFVLSLKDAVDVHTKLSSGSTDAISCSTCDEGNVATCWCRQCDDFLCQDCLTAHRRVKLTRDHDTLSLEELKSRSTSNPLAFKSQRQPTCPEHSGEELRFYCQTCQSPICRDCLVLEHKDHEHGYLPKVVGGIREKLSDSADKAQPKIDEYQILKEKVANKKTELDTNKKKAQDAIAEAIDAAIKEFTDNARRKQAELEEKLATITATRLKQLSATEDNVESALGCLSSTVDYARKIVEHGSDFDVVNVHSDVTARLDILLAGQVPEICDDVGFVAFKGNADVNLKEIHFGNLVDSPIRIKFTTLGATGREGPTSLGTHYSGQDHEHLVTLHDGIQHFTVPETVTYSIEAAGAAAGWGPEDLKSARGRGAVMNGTFRLEKGETLKILVGQEGAEIENSIGVGGGGGTFVTKSDNTPLIIAGGGGGGGKGLKTHNPLCDGTVSTAGNRSFAVKKTGYSGGTDGQGATEWEDNYMGGGGGGLLTDGGSSKQFGGDSCERGGEGGKAFVNGGVGGRGKMMYADAVRLGQMTDQFTVSPSHFLYATVCSTVMAEAIISQISDDFLECTICLEPYKNPKVLPCLHNFCKDCLKKFVAQQSEGKGGNFPCPTCRIETELPGGGVEGLKDNFFVLSLKDAVDVHKKLSPGSTDAITCSTCDEGNMATCWCRQCDDFLCQDCLTAHRRVKLTRDHDTLSLDELKSRSTSNQLAFKSQRQPTCPEHNGEELRFYCQTCQSPICRDCLVLEHKDHEHGYLPKVVGGIREKLSESADKAQPKIDEYRIIKEKVANKKTELDTNKKKAQDAIAEAIEAAIKEFTDNARRKQAELEEKLATITATRHKQLSATEDTVESAMGCLSSTVDYARKIVEHGSDFDVVNVHSDVTARLDILLTGLLPEVPDNVSFVTYNASTNVSVKDTSFGEILESAFCTAKFTTLGATGRLGPTTLGTHYRGQDHEHLVTLHDGIQHFTVPATGTYSIEAAGAAAGWSPKDLKSARGRGAVMKGTFRLEKGETTKILVGQEGAGTKQDKAGVGGGGGTFLTKSDNTPLIIAGGGGGGGRGLNTHNPLCDGTVSTAGNRSFAGKKTGFGGTDGQGATEWEGNYIGGGGGGLLTDGGSSKHFAGDSCNGGGEGGKAFVNGGVGGRDASASKSW
ncbi:hypothetical protein Bbelb_001630 [Branchiostoma belcheri]|nr:hypothetical protein Bbelb_001630 [Branchiostoma belcheri]